MASNSLGLDLDNLNISESGTAEAPVAEGASDDAPATEDAPSDAPKSPQTEAKKKEAPYVNPERVKTGGAARVRGLFSLDIRCGFLTLSQDKPTDDELQARMARIREQNEKIKQRRAVRSHPFNW